MSTAIATLQRHLVISPALAGLLATILLAGVVAISSSFYVQPLSGTAFTHPGDHHKYIFMAQNGVASFHVAPFCWRIGTPWLVSQIGLGVTPGFTLVNAVALVVGCGFLFSALFRYGFREVTAFVGVLIYLSVPWTTKLLFMVPWITDGLFYGLTCVALWIAVARKPVWLVILTIAAIPVRETALLFPIMYVLIGPLLGHRFNSGLKAGLVAMVLGVGVLLYFQTLIPAFNHDSEYIHSLPKELLLFHDINNPDPYAAALNVPGSRLEMTLYMLKYRWSHASASEINALTLGVCGIVPFVLALYGLKSVRRSAKWLLILLGFFYLQIVGGSDTQRILASGSTVVILVACIIVDRWVGAKHVMPINLLIISLLTVTMATAVYPAVHLPLAVEFSVVLFVSVIGLAISRLTEYLKQDIVDPRTVHSLTRSKSS